VEYTLTSMGLSLLTPIDQLVDWAEQNHQAIRAARQSVAQRSQTV